jgi:tripartite-type tricarboxylate transporter receptor subunit TctC
MTQLQKTFLWRWAQRALVLTVLSLSTAAYSQSFPVKPIRLVVPYGPAGLPDVLARLVATQMSKTIGQPIFVDNKPGAGGVIATQFVAKAAPDGHTLLLVSSGDFAIIPALRPGTYDPVRYFTAVTEALRGSMFMVANSALGANSVQDLIALAKARPGAINYGSPGNGTTHHLSMEQFKLITKTNLVHVPYKGLAQASPALLSGEISVMFAALPALKPFVDSGQLRVLAVGSSQRSALMPDVPTVEESGLPGFEIGAGFGFVVPAGTPRSVIDRLNAEITKVLNTPEAKATFLALSYTPATGTPEQYAAQIRKYQEHYSRLVREIGLKID